MRLNPAELVERVVKLMPFSEPEADQLYEQLRLLADALKSLTPENVKALRAVGERAHEANLIVKTMPFSICPHPTCVAARAALEAIEKIAGTAE